MQRRKWRKIASLWRFELNAKSGPLEAGDFGEIGENRHACISGHISDRPIKGAYKRLQRCLEMPLSRNKQHIAQRLDSTS